MKMKTLGLVLLTFGLLTIGNSSVYAASPKIAFFDLTTVLDQSRSGKQAKEEFTREKEKIKSQMDEKARSFKTAKEEFEKKRAVMDESTRNKKTKEIVAMQQEGEKFIMESNATLSKLSNELMAPIVDKVLQIVRKIAKEDKYDYVFEAGKGGIVYANDAGDLTKRIVAELDKNPPASKK
jgi:outer membrane protein